MTGNALRLDCNVASEASSTSFQAPLALLPNARQTGKLTRLAAGADVMSERAFSSATELSKEIRDRRIGCLELLDFYLARAERYNPALNAIVVWQIDQARDRARAADAALERGESWGPLHGIPMTVKESFNVAGLPTTFGNPIWKDNIAAENAS
jgi:hypothetical protein